MQKSALLVVFVVAAVASPLLVAEEKRELGAHEHGVGAFNIAFEGNSVAMELKAPGADIVGFEYQAKSAADRAKIDEAVAILAKPQDLFKFPEDAACTIIEANVSVIAEEEHHSEEGHVEGTEHAEGEEHEEDEHAELEDGAGHTEFDAEYLLNCDNPEAVDRIEFSYFTVFENARELEVQMISDKGAAGFEVERDAPVIDLAGQI